MQILLRCSKKRETEEKKEREVQVLAWENDLKPQKPGDLISTRCGGGMFRAFSDRDVRGICAKFHELL